MGSAAPHPSPRAGGVLLLVLCVMAVVLSTTLLAASVFRSRLRLTRDTLRREAARDRLLLCVSNAVDTLLADTNGVDHVGEAWSADFGTPPLRCVLSDEGGLLPLRVAATNVLAEALSAVPSLTGHSAAEPPAVVATRLASWRDRWRADHQDAAPPAFGFYADALATFGGPGAESGAAALRALATPYGDGPVNLNTAPAAVVEALLRASGAAPDIAEAMSARLVAARAAGGVAADAGPRTLRRLLLGEGRVATDAEAAVLASVSPHFGASSHLFRGRFECASPAVALEFVYDREAHRFLLWDE